VSCKSWGDKSIIQQNLQIIGGINPQKLFGGLFPHPSQVCYFWLQVVEKAKEPNLMAEDWLCVMQKFGAGQSICDLWWKCWGDVSPPPYPPPFIHPGLLSLTSGGRKNKRAELDDRRLTLCRAKVGGQKH